MDDRILLHLTGMHVTKYGAFEGYLVRLVEECRRLGWRSVVQVESRPAPDAYVRHLAASGADVRVVRTHGNGPGGAFRLAALIRSAGPRIVHAHFLDRWGRLVTPWAAHLAGAGRVVCSVHNVHNLSRRSTARFAYNRYDAVLAVSRAVERDLLNGGVRRARVHTHYLGLVGERAPSAELRARIRRELGVREDAAALCTIGFDAPFKGLDVLVDAFAEVARLRPAARLVVIGVDPARSALPARAASHGVSDRIHWAGIRDEGWRLLNAADVYVQPSRFGEGLPLAIMEAMALGLPVVATQVAGNSEAVLDGENGYLVPPGDAASLASALLRVVDDRSSRRALGEAGSARYRRFFTAERSIASLVHEHYGLQP